jgi:anti-sigma B factor antagonist
MSTFEIRRQTSGSVVVLAVAGPIDGQTYRALDDALTQALSGGGRGLVVDLAGATYISSAGCGALIGAFSTLESRRGAMVIVGARPPVSDTFATLGLTQVFAFSHAVADAVRRVTELTRSAVG